MKVNEVEFSRN